MSEAAEKIEELKLENVRLLEEVDRYRTATKDALQQIDWCIGYFVGCNKRHIAQSLGANRAYIRRHFLHRPEQSLPTHAGDSSGGKA